MAGDSWGDSSGVGIVSIALLAGDAGVSGMRTSSGSKDFDRVGNCLGASEVESELGAWGASGSGARWEPGSTNRSLVTVSSGVRVPFHARAGKDCPV